MHEPCGAPHYTNVILAQISNIITTQQLRERNNEKYEKTFPETSGVELSHSFFSSSLFFLMKSSYKYFAFLNIIKYIRHCFHKYTLYVTVDARRRPIGMASGAESVSVSIYRS